MRPPAAVSLFPFSHGSAHLALPAPHTVSHTPFSQLPARASIRAQRRRSLFGHKNDLRPAWLGIACDLIRRPSFCFPTPGTTLWFVAETQQTRESRTKFPYYFPSRSPTPLLVFALCSLECEPAPLLAFPLYHPVAASGGAVAAILHINRANFPRALAISGIACGFARSNGLGVVGNDTPLGTARVLIAGCGTDAAVPSRRTLLLTGREGGAFVSVPDSLALFEHS
jgi:hypothetical protein